jgi:hypothetical protein
MRFSFKITVYWDVTPCSLADRYQRFGGTSCLHLRRGRRRVVSQTGTNVSEELAASIFKLKESSTLKMEAASSSETLLLIYLNTR